MEGVTLEKLKDLVSPGMSKRAIYVYEHGFLHLLSVCSNLPTNLCLAFA